MKSLPAIVTLCLAGNALPQAELGRANYPLEIIQPRPGLDVKNRFYKAYPGLEYNVRLAVIGGVYPFVNDLVKAPAGMRIDKDRGEIVWPKPTADQAAHPVTVKVTDQEGKTAEVSWTITVTTEGFLFVDAEKGRTIAQGGQGTSTNPWKTLRDLYGVKEAEPAPVAGHYREQEFHPGEFVYFRQGAYETFPIHAGGKPGPLGWEGAKKPAVWLAYPGESPELRMTPHVNMNADHFYLDGFKVDARGGWTPFRIPGKPHHVTMRRNDFSDLGRLLDTSDRFVSNVAFIFLAQSDQPGTEFVSIQDNRFHNCQGEGYALLGYGSNKTLIENNRVWDFAKAKNQIWGFSPKASNTRWFIRGNILSEVAHSALHSQAANSDPQGHIEFSHNLVFARGATAMDAYSSKPTGDGPLFIFRNTFVGGVAVHHAIKDDGPFHFYNNVIVNDTKGGIGGAEDPSLVIVKDNLVSTAADKIVDAEGNLTKEFAKYLGTHGHLSKEGKAPPWPVMPK